LFWLRLEGNLGEEEEGMKGKGPRREQKVGRFGFRWGLGHSIMRGRRRRRGRRRSVGWKMRWMRDCRGGASYSVPSCHSNSTWILHPHSNMLSWGK
jgi:hypothetical protein